MFSSVMQLFVCLREQRIQRMVDYQGSVTVESYARHQANPCMALQTLSELAMVFLSNITSLTFVLLVTPDPLLLHFLPQCELHEYPLFAHADRRRFITSVIYLDLQRKGCSSISVRSFEFLCVNDNSIVCSGRNQILTMLTE